jgi:hypothetical protein
LGGGGWGNRKGGREKKIQEKREKTKDKGETEMKRGK